MNLKPWISRFALALGIPLALLLAVEGLLRATSWGWPTTFIVPARIAGRDVRTDNQFFGFRFFPPALVRTPAPLVLPPSNPNTLRIVLLGESAAMGEPLPEYGMARILQRLLEARHPAQRFEVVNAAMTAINSHVIREIAEDLAACSPDLFILYLGNNEVVGPFGPGTALGQAAAPSWLTRARVLFSRTRCAQLLKRLLPASDVPLSWAGMEMFRNEVPADDPRLRALYAAFQSNLEAILHTAERSRAPALVCTVAVNLKDCAPLSNRGESLEAFHQAQAAAASNDWTAAARLFSRARDLDTLRFRADSTLNRLLRETAELQGARLVDMEAYLAAHSEQGLPGRDLFLDHVHFNFEGNRLVAQRLAEAVEEALQLKPTGNLSPETVAQRLFYTPWSELDMVSLMIERYSRPPFATQEGQPQVLAALHTQQAELQQIIRNSSLDPFRSTALSLMRQHPEDGLYFAEWGKILQAENQRPEAGHYFTKALEWAPHRYDLRGLLAVIKSLEGRPLEGLQLIAADQPPNPLMAQVLIQCARELAQAGRWPEALQFVEKAQLLLPDSPEVQLLRANCEARRGRPDAAETILRQALAQHPRDERLCRELIALLLLQEKSSEAQAVLNTLEQHLPEAARQIRVQIER